MLDANLLQIRKVQIGGRFADSWPGPQPKTFLKEAKELATAVDQPDTVEMPKATVGATMAPLWPIGGARGCWGYPTLG